MLYYIWLSVIVLLLPAFYFGTRWRKRLESERAVMAADRLDFTPLELFAVIDLSARLRCAKILEGLGVAGAVLCFGGLAVRAILWAFPGLIS